MTAVESIHSKSVIHRDIKLANVLVNYKKGGKKPELLLCDFGFAVRKDEIRGHYRCGTPGYVAPEVFKNKSGFSEKIDIFSLGALLFKVST